jgi:hypothetical protein
LDEVQQREQAATVGFTNESRNCKICEVHRHSLFLKAMYIPRIVCGLVLYTVLSMQNCEEWIWKIYSPNYNNLSFLKLESIPLRLTSKFGIHVVWYNSHSKALFVLTIHSTCFGPSWLT